MVICLVIVDVGFICQSFLCLRTQRLSLNFKQLKKKILDMWRTSKYIETLWKLSASYNYTQNRLSVEEIGNMRIVENKYL